MVLAVLLAVALAFVYLSMAGYTGAAFLARHRAVCPLVGRHQMTHGPDTDDCHHFHASGTFGVLLGVIWPIALPVMIGAHGVRIPARANPAHISQLERELFDV